MARRRTRNIRCKAVVGVVALLGTVVLHAGPASAQVGVWRTSATGCMGGVNSTDSLTHNFWYDGSALYGLSQLMRDATTYARTYSYDPTDINTANAASHAPDTDVVVFDWDIGANYCGYNWHTVANPSGTIVGLAICMGLAVSVPGACEQHYVDYDESFTNNATVWNRITLACHEVGHTLGLIHHTGNSCMVDPHDGTKAFIDGDDFAWINANYN